MKLKLRVKTLFISDVHLGIADSKAAQASHLLRNTMCDKLVLNGDIIDAWALSGSGRWTKAHTNFVRTVLRKLEKESTEVVYLRGNHDDILERFLPFRLEGFSLVREHIHESTAGRYLVVHGDGFDHVASNHAWLAKLGGMGYDVLLRVNRIYNWQLRLRGREPFSLSAWAKRKVKQAVSFTGRYEEQLQQLAGLRGCTGIICGHIHTAANKMVGSTHYLNCGDWVESLTAVIEHFDGKFEVITYRDFCERTGRREKGGAHTPELSAEAQMGRSAVEAAQTDEAA
jgi:UDP-2,3-diacylglucosamine pyrophosphatase LpxH